MGLEAFIQAAEFQDDCETECWREDYLHRYFELMEKLQRNLEEMDRLQDILGGYEPQAFHKRLQRQHYIWSSLDRVFSYNQTMLQNI